MESPHTKNCALIYQHNIEIEKIKNNMAELCNQIGQAIDTMIDSGVTNFFIPIEQESGILKIALETVLNLKTPRPRLTLVFNHPDNEGEFINYTSGRYSYADEIVLCRHPKSIIDLLLAESQGLILCFENDPTLSARLTSHALQHRWPLININI